MSDLNRPQREAVRYSEGPVLVLAGAGSGKTRVITRKIAYLIEHIGLEPRHIAAVTFTNKAAREMKARVGELLRGQNTRGLNISTFHTLGLNILRKNFSDLDLKPGFSLFDEQDSGNLIQELLHNDGSADNAAAAIRWRISEWKNAMQTPQQAELSAQSDQDIRAARVYARYQKSDKKSGRADTGAES